MKRVISAVASLLIACTLSAQSTSQSFANPFYSSAITQTDGTFRNGYAEFLYYTPQGSARVATFYAYAPGIRGPQAELNVTFPYEPGHSIASSTITEAVDPNNALHYTFSGEGVETNADGTVSAPVGITLDFTLVSMFCGGGKGGSRSCYRMDSKVTTAAISR